MHVQAGTGRRPLAIGRGWEYRRRRIPIANGLFADITVNPADTVDGKGAEVMDSIELIPDEVKTLVTVLKGQIFLLGKDWDNLLDTEKREVSEAAVKTVTELNDLVRGTPPNLRALP